MKATINLVALVLLVAIFLGGKMIAQQNTQLSPEQQKIVQLLKDDMPYHRDKVKDLAPILVSKYLVFTKNWLKIIGDDKKKQVTSQQFKVWTDKLDKVYECYEEFMGKRPFYSDVILVETRSDRLATANRNSIAVNLGREDMDDELKEIRQGNPTYTMLHEMGHVFSWASHGRTHLSWIGEVENATEILVSYALEVGDIRDKKNGRFMMGVRPYAVTGARRRHNKINAAIQNFKTGDIIDFGYHKDTVYDLYMFCLVDKVGWNVMKKAIQSYNPGNQAYTPTKSYDFSKVDPKFWGERTQDHGRVHAFLDRVAYFHDEARKLAMSDRKVLQSIPVASRALSGEEVLRSLYDRGKLLDERFIVKTTPLKNTDVKTVATAPPLVQKPKSPTALPKKEIQALQAELKSLQEQLDALPKTSKSEPEMVRLYNEIAILENKLSAAL